MGKDRVKHSPYRNYNGDLNTSAIAGQAVFNDKGCITCHATAAFRDGLMHDMGTITANSGKRLGGDLTQIRTPTLIELWDSTPYLHHGGATSLEQVLATGEHQVELSSTEKADLVQFLLSIDRAMYIDDE